MAQVTIIPVDQTRPPADIIDHAVDYLERGELVVAPTETRYGLLVKADSPDALKRLYHVKGRARTVPTALFVPDVKSMWSLGENNPVAQCLAETFLPGPLTLVLKARVEWTAPRVVNGKIGIRHSSSAVIQAIVGHLTWYPSATSANLSGRPEPDTATAIAELLGNQVGLYLESGPLTGRSSTVVDCTGGGLQIIREGAIAATALAEALQRAGIPYA